MINWADSEDRKSFVIFSSVKEESSDGFSDSMDPDKDDVLDMDLDSNSNQKEDVTKNAPNRCVRVSEIILKIFLLAKWFSFFFISYTYI